MLLFYIILDPFSVWLNDLLSCRYSVSRTSDLKFLLVTVRLQLCLKTSSCVIDEYVVKEAKVPIPVCNSQFGDMLSGDRHSGWSLCVWLIFFHINSNCYPCFSLFYPFIVSPQDRLWRILFRVKSTPIQQWWKINCPACTDYKRWKNLCAPPPKASWRNVQNCFFSNFDLLCYFSVYVINHDNERYLKNKTIWIKFQKFTLQAAFVCWSLGQSAIVPRGLNAGVSIAN